MFTLVRRHHQTARPEPKNDRDSFVQNSGAPPRCRLLLFIVFLRRSVRTARLKVSHFLSLPSFPLCLGVAFSRARSLPLFRSLSPSLAHARVRAACPPRCRFFCFLFFCGGVYAQRSSRCLNASLSSVSLSALSPSPSLARCAWRFRARGLFLSSALFLPLWLTRACARRSAALSIFLFSFFRSARTALFEMFECLSLLYLARPAPPLSLSGSVCVTFSRARSLPLLRSLSPALAHPPFFFVSIARNGNAKTSTGTKRRGGGSFKILVPVVAATGQACCVCYHIAPALIPVVCSQVTVCLADAKGQWPGLLTNR